MSENTSKQIVIDTVLFQDPVRPARDLWVLPAAMEKHGDLIRNLQKETPTDFAGDGFQDPCGGEALYNCGSFTDPWGSGWENQTKGLLGQVRHYPLNDWSNLDDFSPPFDLTGKGFEEVPAKLAETPDKFHFGVIPSLFHRICWLREPSRIFMDFYTNAEELKQLRDMVHEYNMRHLEELLKYDYDGIFIGDDWGTQSQLFIRPDMWREWFKPCYAAYFKKARDAGKLAFFHSDGYIIDIISDLIEIGVQALNCQVACMGVEELAERFTGKICFWGELDRQHLLPNGTPEKIKEAGKKNLRFLATDHGGYIMQSELNADVPEENIRALFECYRYMRE